MGLRVEERVFSSALEWKYELLKDGDRPSSPESIGAISKALVVSNGHGPTFGAGTDVASKIHGRIYEF